MATTSSFWPWVFRNRLRTHVLYWLGILCLWAFPLCMITYSYGPLINSLCYLFPQILASYMLVYYQVPHLLFRGKYLSFVLSLTGVAYVSTAWARIMKIYVYEPSLGVDLPQDSLISIFTEVEPLLTQYLPMVYTIAIFTLILRLSKDYFEARQKEVQLRKEKTTAEINFLKAQIHPHFLFNTLNNLYTLTLRQADVAPEIVLKLKDMLEYMFYGCNEPLVSIGKEIELLQNYIDLERLRYGDRLDLVFQHEKVNKEVEIAPLILLSLVENAFKHGASGDMGKPQIHISLSTSGQSLQFRVFNTKPPQTQPDTQNYRKGIGAGNIKRQLELMYPDKHQLLVHESLLTYEVTLELEWIHEKVPQLV